MQTSSNARFRFFAYLYIFIFGITIQNASSCGLSWTPPSTPFPFLAWDGSLTFWKTVGNVKGTGEFEIPIIIGFSSASNYDSPILGRGWSFPIFDSRIEQTDDNEFKMFQPDGNIVVLKRNKNHSSILEGGGWVGEIGINTIEVKANCGWSLSFTNGYLTGIRSPSSGTLVVNKNSDGSKSISDNGNILLKVAPLPSSEDHAEDQVSVTIAGTDLRWSLSKRPIIAEINNTSIVQEMAKSLREVTTIEGKKISFLFEVNKEMQPTLLSGDNMLTWDPRTRKLLKNNDWTCTLCNIYGIDCIKRTNASGAIQLLGSDFSKGIEVTQLNGTSATITEYFTSGILLGNTRKVIKLSPSGNEQIIEQYSYDEYGNVIRAKITNSNNTISISTAKNVTVAVNDNTQKILWKRTSDQEGRLSELEIEGKTYKFDYSTDPKSTLVTRVIDGNVSQTILNQETTQVFLAGLSQKTQQR